MVPKNGTIEMVISWQQSPALGNSDDGGGFGVPVGKESARLSFYIKLENYRPSRPCGRVKSSAGPMGTMRVGLMSS